MRKLSATRCISAVGIFSLAVFLLFGNPASAEEEELQLQTDRLTICDEPEHAKEYGLLLARGVHAQKAIWLVNQRAKKETCNMVLVTYVEGPMMNGNFQYAGGDVFIQKILVFGMAHPLGGTYLLSEPLEQFILRIHVDVGRENERPA